VNNELKGKITSVGSGGPNQLSIQFYKDQISKLETEVSELQSKIKKLLVDHENVKD
jgi:ubiquinone biosynthesis protein UbiJ